MNFVSFPKIPSGGARSSAAPGGVWVALEKVHGAQLVISVSSTDVRFGKRKEWLAADEAFFGWQLIRRRLELGARALHSALGTDATLYGELFGGAYPHPI